MTRSHAVLLGLILLFAASFRLALLNQEFDRNSEGCGAFYGLLARNYFRYSLSQSYGLPIMSMGEGATPVFYANHPATTPLLIAFVHLLTGYRGEYDILPGEWQTRLPTVCFTIACAVLIFFLVKRRSTPRAGLLAAAAFSAIPMTLYYGGMPDVISPQLIFFALLTVAAYERFTEKRNGKRFALLILAFGSAAIMDWPAFFLVPILGLHYIRTQPTREWTWIVGFGSVSAIIFMTLYIHSALGQSSWGWMAAQVERRAMSGATDASHQFSMAEWATHALWDICVGRHTLIVVTLALGWAAMAATRHFQGAADRFTGLLLAWGTVHVLMGRQGVYQHEWWWWPITPSLVIAAGLMVDQILVWFESRRVPRHLNNALVLLLIVLFAGWNVRATLQELEASRPTENGKINYSLHEFGDVIRASAAPDRIVMVAESDESLGFWYYADRALKRQIWDLSTFERRLNDGKVDFSFETGGSYTAPIAAMIVPKSYQADLVELVRDLDARYAKTDTGKFLVYNIDSPQTPP